MGRVHVRCRWRHRQRAQAQPQNRGFYNLEAIPDADDEFDDDEDDDEQLGGEPSSGLKRLLQPNRSPPRKDVRSRVAGMLAAERAEAWEQ